MDFSGHYFYYNVVYYNGLSYASKNCNSIVDQLCSLSDIHYTGIDCASFRIVLF